MAREHILLFENEKGLKRIITLLLRQAKMKVTISDKAENALDIIHSSRKRGDNVSAVIIDVSYPYPEGERLVRLLQNEEVHPPSIAITQYGNENDIIDGVRLYNNFSLLQAPFEPRDLFQSIKNATLRTDNLKVTSKKHNQEEKS